MICMQNIPTVLRFRLSYGGGIKKNPEVSLWKRIKCFSFIIRQRNLKTNNDRRFEFVFEDNSVRKIAQLLWQYNFRKASFSKSFLSIRKRKYGVLKFLCFEKRFQKALFSSPSSTDSKPYCWNVRLISRIQ